MLPACPQDLAAKHVANATRNLLIQQRLGDGCIEVAVLTQGVDG